MKHRYSVLALLGLGVATYGRAACFPALLGDEWGRMYAICYGLRRGHTLNPFLRPFLSYWHTVLHSLWGINIVGYRWTSLFLVILGAVAMYAALERFLPGRRPFNLIVASLFLVYPSGYPHLFFERGTYQLGLVLMLFSYAAMGYWLAQGSRLRGTAFFLAVLSTALSLVLYEAHIGLAALLTVVCLLLTRGQPISRRLAGCIPAGIAVVFALGRWRSQLAVGSVFGYTTGNLDLSPRVLMTRLALGYDCSLVRCWTANARRLTPSFMSARGMIALMLVAGAAVTVLAALLLRRKGYLREECSPERIPVSPREYLILGIFGLTAIAAGYMPMIAGFTPSLSHMASRINIIPSAGAALLVALGLAALVRMLRLRAIGATTAFVALALPLITLACLFQVMSQDLTERGWGEQKLIYRQMLELAPDVVPDTEVLLLLPAQRTSQEGRAFAGALPFESGPWGFRAALSILYGHPVRGSFHYCAQDDLRFSAEGVRLPNGETVLPYDGMIVMIYDWRERKLTFPEESGADLPEHALRGLARGRKSILPTPAEHAEWRFLMQ